MRLNIISSLETINAVIGVEMLSQALLPSIVDLSEDSKWRIRQAIIELVPKLAEQLGNEFFNDKLNSLCIAWLSDNVYSVRKAATKNLCELVILFGENWAQEYIFPRIERMLVHANYLYRMTALNCLQVLFEIMSVKTIETIVIPLIRQSASDPVANVRFTVAKCITNIPDNKVSKELLIEFSPLIYQLTNDSDGDVKFHAKQVTPC